MCKEPNEKEAIKIGLALLRGKYDEDDDFSKGMRTLQSLVKHPKNQKPISRGAAENAEE